MEKEFIEIRISFSPFNAELSTGILEMLNVEGIVQEDNFLIAFFKEFDDKSMKKLETFFLNMEKELLIENHLISKSVIANRNWNEEWERSIEPIKVSEKFVIKPSFKNYSKKENEIVLEIDPKMSFGTGYHQTTRIMINLIEKYINKNDLVLDVGTGTGILGIVAAKLGASKVITLDNDEVCEENANENISKNNVNNIVSFFVGTINNVKEKDFDLILANINRHILLDIDLPLKNRIKNNGLIILSGLLIEDKEIVCEKYLKHNLKLIDSYSEDEWLGLVFRA